MTTHNIMVDLETLSTEHNAGILSIGATEFALPHGVPARHFYERIAVESLQGHGFHTSKSTMEWWGLQDTAVRVEAFGGSRDIHIVLIEFRDWLVSIKKSPEDKILLWGYGADFDCKILENAFESVGVYFPVSFRDYRCARTLMSLAPPWIINSIPPNKTKHNALADATYQANVCSVILNNLRWAI